jgi:energy-coupling factor transporter ATP-binding protein EcfA2
MARIPERSAPMSTGSAAERHLRQRGHGGGEVGTANTWTGPLRRGFRLRPQAPRSRLYGRNLADLVAFAAEPLPPPRALERLTKGLLGELNQPIAPLLEAGPGEPTPSLSGGKSQRLRIAARLRSSRRNVLDEPSTGLHPVDIATLIEVAADPASVTGPYLRPTQS